MMNFSAKLNAAINNINIIKKTFVHFGSVRASIVVWTPFVGPTSSALMTHQRTLYLQINSNNNNTPNYRRLNKLIFGFSLINVN